MPSQAPLVYTPAMPLQPTWTSVMSQDVVTTAAIPVNATSAAPVAPFTNAFSGHAEALVLANLAAGGGARDTRVAGDARPQLCHVTRDSSAAAGWRLQPLFGGITANEVASATAYAGTSSAASVGFFSDESGLSFTQLGSDGATWADPLSIGQGAIANLKVAYSPAGRVVLYGNSPTGDLLTAYQETIGGPFVTSTCAMQGGLIQGDFHLCLTDEASWTLVANVNGAPSVYTGVVGAANYSSIEQVTQFQGTLTHIALGYWNSSRNTLMFLLVDDDNALHVWSANATTSTPVVQPIPNSKVTRAAGHVSTDQTLHVYSIDHEMKLWVLHQDHERPWNDDGTPHWSPYIPLDKEVATVVSDTNPADAPSLFACAAADYSLRLHVRDANTGMWKSGPVLQHAEQAFEIVRFRTEVTIYDASGVALSGYAVTLASAEGASAAEISVGGMHYAVDSDTPVTLQTDHTGKLTMAVVTNAGMATPSLTLQAEGLAAPLTIQAAAPVHNYLAGLAPLNPTNPGGALPIFDEAGGTLAAATVNGRALAPGAQGKDNSTLAGVAAQAIQQTALVGTGQTPKGVAGYSFSVSGPRGPRFELHRTPAEVEAVCARLLGRTGAGATDGSGAAAAAGELGSVWNDVKKWAGDVLEGIKNGLIKIADALVDAATQVASFSATIGDLIVKGVQLALKGIEQAAHFIAGVFASVEAALADVLDWLKAMFDFSAIWRTKKVFEDGLLALPLYLKRLLDTAQTGANTWFKDKESEVDTAFEKMKASFAGKSFGDLQGFPAPGQPPSSQTKVGGNATQADLTGNVHHNWFQDKVSANAPSDFGVSPDQDVAGMWESISPQIMASATDFLAAAKDFEQGFSSTIQDPKSFGSVAIPDFLDGIKNLIDAGLELCDAIVTIFIKVAKLAMDGVETLLATPLNFGPLNTLWKWIAAQAGDPSDDQLTLGAVLALMLAFPATVAYKLIEGADAEPFPDGKSPWGSSAAGLRAGAGAGAGAGEMPESARVLSAILQMGYAIPANISDVLGPTAPMQLSIFMLGLSGLIWVLANGMPDPAILAAGITAPILVVSVGAAVWGTLRKFIQAIKSLGGNLINDALIVVFALYGVGRIVLVALSKVTDDLQLIAGLLLPLPYIVGLLNLTMFRDEIAAPLFLATVLIFDDIGFVGGGGVELVDVLLNKTQAITA